MLLNRERALATMEKYDLEALVATSAENVYYLSDYFTEHLYHFAPGGFAGAVLPRDPDKPATLIIQEWELPQLTEKPTWMPQTRVLDGIRRLCAGGRRARPVRDEAARADPRRAEARRRQPPAPPRERADRAGARAARASRSTSRRRSRSCARTSCPTVQPAGGVNVFREIRNVKTPGRADAPAPRRARRTRPRYERSRTSSTSASRRASSFARTARRWRSRVVTAAT